MPANPDLKQPAEAHPNKSDDATARQLQSGEGTAEVILMRTPMRRFGQPEELIAAAVLLASDGASIITGQCLAVDDGHLASGVNS